MTKRNQKKKDNGKWLKRLERNPLAKLLSRMLLRVLIDWFMNQ